MKTVLELSHGEENRGEASSGTAARLKKWMPRVVIEQYEYFSRALILRGCVGENIMFGSNIST